MKVRLYTSILAFLLTFGPLRAQQSNVSSTESVLNAVSGVNTVNEEVKKTGTLDRPCPDCTKSDFDKIYDLDKKEIELETPFYRKEKKPYSVLLKRTKNSPNKISLKFKNGHRVCGKVVMYTNPYSNSLNFDCLFYVTEYEEQIIDINFSDLKSEEDQSFELKFTKDDLDRSKYSIELNSLNGKAVNVLKDNKFFDRGINLKVVESKN